MFGEENAASAQLSALDVMKEIGETYARGGPCKLFDLRDQVFNKRGVGATRKTLRKRPAATVADKTSKKISAKTIEETERIDNNGIEESERIHDDDGRRRPNAGSSTRTQKTAMKTSMVRMPTVAEGIFENTPSEFESSSTES